ncbi:MAG: hypothetical protein ACI9Y7_001514 [Dokdonia sp.]|jgi:hypothetical protein
MILRIQHTAQKLLLSQWSDYRGIHEFILMRKDACMYSKDFTQ